MTSQITTNHQRFSTVSHEHFCSIAPNRGEPAWLMIVECADGRFYLEDEFGDWEESPEVMPRKGSARDPLFYPQRHLALKAAGRLISEKFGTDLGAWLIEAGTNAK